MYFFKYFLDLNLLLYENYINQSEKGQKPIDHDHDQSMDVLDSLLNDLLQSDDDTRFCKGTTNLFIYCFIILFIYLFIFFLIQNLKI